ncbi:hypothetical protein [Anaeromyxobacter oryzisoli]|uniref:hypothetical protein n=1 Tax=Anaeromyxobacter oryzisoli TaxID=2925408 RepID=UPI001F5800CF|nr:hypothetical protein [Anaeromyxobacter sp. SG63]
MKVGGFTFVRNAIRFDYPIVEAIQSILPLCDEVVVAVGKSEDDTLGLIRRIPSPKIRILETVWDDTIRQGGRVLAVETDKAFQALSPDLDWAVYIQGDEVLHERGLTAVRDAMERYADDRRVEGLLFDWLHFYGSYDYVAEAIRWYRHEVRIVRRDPDIHSYGDAQGFRRRPSEKLRVKPTGATIHHYGYVRPPKTMQDKARCFNQLWHDDAWIARNVPCTAAFDYSQIDALRRFEGTHPAVMRPRIAAMNWAFDRDLSANRWSFKDRLKLALECLTGWRPGEFRNYRLLR